MSKENMFITPVLKPERQWREEDGVIYFAVTSNGMTGLEWEKYLDEKGFKLGDYGKSLLRSDDFVLAEKGTVHNVAVLKGVLFEDGKRTTKNIRAEADRRDLKHGKDIHPEIACLIRDNFSDEELKEMGLWAIIVFHESIEDSDGDPCLLGSSRSGDGRWLDAYYRHPRHRWDRDCGFACVVSQVSSED